MRWRLRATVDIHCAVFRAALPLIQAYVSALRSVWLRGRDTGIRAYPATTECYDPPQTRGAVPDEIVVDDPYPDDKLN